MTFGVAAFLFTRDSDVRTGRIEQQNVSDAISYPTQSWSASRRCFLTRTFS